MAVPTNRDGFSNHCLRKLGYPVIDINVTQEQIDDRVDEAILYWQDYHFDGSQRLLYKHTVTSTDVTNRYIALPQNIIGINDMLPLNSATSSSSLFNLNYQIRLNDLFYNLQTPLLSYYTVMLQVSNLHEMFVGKQPIRYNRHINRLWIDADWGTQIGENDNVVIDCYGTIDQDTYPDMWADRWLARYATQLIKQTWGSNLSKFEGLTLPGGVSFSGQKIYDDATAEIARMEEEMIIGYSLPVTDFIG